MGIVLLWTGAAAGADSKDAAPVECAVGLQLVAQPDSGAKADGVGIIECADGYAIGVEVKARLSGKPDEANAWGLFFGTFTPVDEARDLYGRYRDDSGAPEGEMSLSRTGQASALGMVRAPGYGEGTLEIESVRIKRLSDRTMVIDQRNNKVYWSSSSSAGGRVSNLTDPTMSTSKGASDWLDTKGRSVQDELMRSKQRPGRSYPFALRNVQNTRAPRAGLKPKKD